MRSSSSTRRPIELAEQGSFMAGGSVERQDGEEFRGGHAYVHYQIPIGARALPLVLVHGGSTTGMCWESTPDGREGFRDLLLRLGFAVYVLDLPGRGRAGGTAAGDSPRRQLGDVQTWNVWRLGPWIPPDPRSLFDGLQLPDDEAVLDQLLRQRSASVVSRPPEEDREVAANAIAAVIDRTGPCALVTHSNGAQYGWLAAIRHHDVRGIVAYEPGTFVFPADGPPAAIDTEVEAVALINTPIEVTSQDFQRLTAIPVQLVYGDNIERVRPSPVTGVELWRVNTQRARQFIEALTARGGDAELVDLPSLGMQGNTHFPFSDLNNGEVAALLGQYLESRDIAGPGLP